MPTGYTDAIKDGITFREFAMNCARAFGALILMRDDPPDATIPDEFTPDAYYTDSVARAEKRIAELHAMDAAAKEQGARDEFTASAKRYAEELEESRGLRRRYERMLDEVKAWEPPTPDHKGLKEFMIQQITESIRFDCWDGRDNKEYRQPPKHIGPGDWWAKEVAEAERSLAYAKRELREEAERAKSRTEWVRALRASL